MPSDLERFLTKWFLGAFAKLRIANVCPSVRPSAGNSSAPTGRIFMKFDILRKSIEKIQVSLKLGKNKGYLT